MNVFILGVVVEVDFVVVVVVVEEVVVVVVVRGSLHKNSQDPRFL